MAALQYFPKQWRWKIKTCFSKSSSAIISENNYPSHLIHSNLTSVIRKSEFCYITKPTKAFTIQRTLGEKSHERPKLCSRLTKVTEWGTLYSNSFIWQKKVIIFSPIQATKLWKSRMKWRGREGGSSLMSLFSQAWFILSEMSLIEM